MNVRPVTPSPPVDRAEHTVPVRAATTRSVPAESALTDIAALSGLSPSDAAKLIRALELPALSGQPSQSGDLLGEAVSAVQQQNLGRALELLTTLVRLDPIRANALGAEPGLEAIRAQVDQLLNRLASIAGLDAQSRLAEAAKLLESRDLPKLAGWDTTPQTLLTTANRFYEAGGYANYIYAASLAQVVVEGTRATESAIRLRAAVSAPSPTPAPTRLRRLKTLWSRAPLLLMLISWFVLGLAAVGVVSALHYFWPEQFPSSMVDGGFELWGIGLLALIVSTFYTRVRHTR